MPAYVLCRNMAQPARLSALSKRTQYHVDEDDTKQNHRYIHTQNKLVSTACKCN